MLRYAALRYLAVLGLLPILFAPAPAAAVTAKEKMETCKFGAEHQKLTGAKRKRFISRCMGRTGAKRQRKPAKKPAAAQPAAAPPPAPKQ